MESGQELSARVGSYNEKKLELVSLYTSRSDWCGVWLESTVAVEVKLRRCACEL